jgi:hypothetical protein
MPNCFVVRCFDDQGAARPLHIYRARFRILSRFDELFVLSRLNVLLFSSPSSFQVIYPNVY